MKKMYAIKGALGAALLALSAGAFAQAVLSDGVVRKVDRANAKVTIKHGEIKNLDMPPMTMVFTAKDPAQLDQLKPGDKVKFHAEDKDGKLTVTEIQAVK